MRLGELYQQRGDTSRAASNYARFVAAWRDADPDLQPKVDDARRRLKSLARTEGGGSPRRIAAGSARKSMVMGRM